MHERAAAHRARARPGRSSRRPRRCRARARPRRRRDRAAGRGCARGRCRRRGAPPTPAPRSARASISSSSREADSASRTCSRTVWPTRGTSPMAIAPVSGSAPSTPRTRKSPSRCSGRFSSITRPISRPFSSSARSVSGRSSTTCCTRSSAGSPRELDDEVALGGRDHELRADRPGALRDDGAHGQPLEHDADGALLGAAAGREEARRAAAAESGKASEHRQASEPVDQLLDRRRVGIGDRDHDCARRACAGRPVISGPSCPSPTCAWNGVARAPAGNVDREQRQRRATLLLAPGSDHAVGRARSDDCGIRRQIGERLGQIVRRLAVLGRAEERDEIGRRARVPRRSPPTPHPAQREPRRGPRTPRGRSPGLHLRLVRTGAHDDQVTARDQRRTARGRYAARA